MVGRFKRQEPMFPVPDGEYADTFPQSGITLPRAAREVHRAITRALQNRVADHGVSMGQWYFLRALWEEDGLTQRELSQRVGMMEPTTVTALNNLERCDLVQRVRNPHDRRKVNIYLTPKGKALRADILPCVEEIEETATQGISPGELALTISVLRRVSANLDALPPIGADDDLG
ncbi:MarR family winged helix-turn-helix transcriptional regulator [Azospirillum isscasi]|uniref:MarR family winged helix-turn-helix transcriptional regulator n=1 Tax=Azospirillum isscasi TaxID=3053926 RepID=A0ABU0WQ90_9PROT|nr:MarR family winged helix-turn-helix transcriptional regulator [Azospirillum isscasi]MDQ2106346.1 MarR family winged helix-turn-helix transcriptional regulator [Azospirillum isscasi]